MVKISDVVVDFLVENNITVVFGVIGSANSHIFDSLRKENTIQIIAVHHEQVAVMAMGSYYRTTGKLSAAIVTAGGGTTNALTGIVSNYADSIAGIIITGQEQSYYIDEYSNMRMYGVQGCKTTHLFSEYTKSSVVITTDNVYDVLNNSIQLTLSGRPGPVHIDIPFDTQSKLIPKSKFKIYQPNQSDDISKYAGILFNEILKSKRPVIIAGHGIKLSNSELVFNKFINKVKIPTILTWSAIDVLDDLNPNNFGRAGVQGERSSNIIIQNSDLLIVFGSRLSLLQTGYDRSEFAPNSKIIHIDIDETETNKFSDININCDIKLLIDKLYSYDIIINIDKWIDYCNEIKTILPRNEKQHEHTAEYINSYKFIDELSDKLSNNTIITTDMGTALLSGFYSMKIKQGQTMFTSLGLGEMGYGIAAAIGASFDGRDVLCLNCDGGMMMNLQELQTIKTYNLPVKIVVFNNDGYLMIKHTQNMLFNGSKTCVDVSSGLSLPDYNKVAKAFDYKYFTYDELDLFLDYKGQCILEIFMDPNQEFTPKVRGTLGDEGKIIPGDFMNMYPRLSDSEINKIKKIYLDYFGDNNE